MLYIKQCQKYMYILIIVDLQIQLKCNEKNTIIQYKTLCCQLTIILCLYCTVCTCDAGETTLKICIKLDYGLSVIGMCMWNI